MHSFTAFIALAALAHAAPVAEKATPSTYFEGYLEPYMTYHTRYLAIGCSGKQGSQFFKDCCSPLLATETLEADRLPYCIPNATESASASAADASATASPIHQTASEDLEAQSAYAEAVTSEAAAVSSAAPTSTSSAEPEATSEASAPSGDIKTGGYATYFYQNGNAGACGQYHSDSEFGIAIDSNGYWGNDFSQGSDLCGRVINIVNTNNQKTVTATVWDVCPTCANDNSLDLSVAAFTAIASESEGMVPISWSFA